MKISPINTISFAQKQKNKLPLRASIGYSKDCFLIDMVQKVETLHKMPKNLQFREAKTLTEAMQFGRKSLYIPDYIGFKEDDVDIINWINQGLVNVNNYAKGRIVMPIEITYVDRIINQQVENASAVIDARGRIQISRYSTENIKTNVKDFLNNIMQQTKEDQFKQDIENLTYLNAREIYSILLENEQKNDNFSPFSDIYHEMGHQQHKYSIGIKTYLNLSEEAKAQRFHKTEKMYNTFKNSKAIAQKVSSYATKSPVEFVAEVFCKLCNNEEISPDVIKLYKQMGGKVY